jgi:hypothetical protein
MQGEMLLYFILSASWHGTRLAPTAFFRLLISKTDRFWSGAIGRSFNRTSRLLTLGHGFSLCRLLAQKLLQVDCLWEHDFVWVKLSDAFLLRATFLDDLLVFITYWFAAPEEMIWTVVIARNSTWRGGLRLHRFDQLWWRFLQWLDVVNELILWGHLLMSSLVDNCNESIKVKLPSFRVWMSSLLAADRFRLILYLTKLHQVLRFVAQINSSRSLIRRWIWTMFCWWNLSFVDRFCVIFHC